MPPTIDRPLFIVGCPRSGTGLLHQVMRLHPSLAWVTPVSNWICGKPWFRHVPPRLALGLDTLLTRLPAASLPSFLRGPYDGSLEVANLPETHEGHSIWNAYCPDRTHHACSADDVTREAHTGLRDVVRWHLAYHQRPRFLSKTPRSALRVAFLHAVFPDARFVHLVRDGRAVVASILGRRRAAHGTLDRWWGARPPGWEDILSESPVRQAAWMWITFLETFERAAHTLPDAATYTVRYETFTHDPEPTLRALFNWADLDAERLLSSNAAHHLAQIRPSNEAWRTRLTDFQQAELDVLAPTLRRYEYAS